MATSYDEVLYPSHARKESHPVRLATMAKLAGLSPAPLESCRVLELGCGDGGNIIPIAFDYPGAQVVGMDLAARPLEAGREFAAKLGLKNLELMQGDLVDWELPGRQFDYIIVHGVYSWVPEAPRDGILRICNQHLAPHGVAFVSYNALPGCYFRMFVWDMLRFHVRDIEDPREKIAACRDLAVKAMQALTDKGHTGAIRTELAELLDRSDPVIYHDDLSPVNTPFYVEQFVSAAARHGLQYMFDADYVREHGLPYPVATKSREQERQYADFVTARRFRESIVCHEGLAVDQTIRMDAALEMFASSRAEAEDEKDDGSQRFRLAEDRYISTDHPVAKRILNRAILAWPESVPVRELLPMEDPAGETDCLVRLMVSSAVELRIEPPKLVARASAQPMVSPMARAQQDAGRGSVVNQRHMEIKLADDLARRCVALLDGTRDRAQFERDLMAEVESGQLELPEDLRQHIGTERFKEVFGAQLDTSLHMLAKLCLLVG